MKENLCLISLGCNKNLIDSEVMLGKLKKYALVDDVQNADVIIVNTCGFIASAKQESINKILEVAMSKKESAILVVSGCLSERYSKELQEEIKEIDIITGVGDYHKIDLMISKYRNGLQKKDSQIVLTPKAFLIDEEQRIITGSKIHAYIKISEGCNQQCSFCAIPSFKGKLQSRSIQSCVKEIEKLLKQGFSDFSFIAQDTSSYMRDFGKKDALVDLIDAVECIDGVKSARILYLYPSSTSESLINKIAESSIFQNYFDMPLQHITDSMLSLMRRGANKKQHLRLLECMKNIPNSFIRTTFLLGHPGETQKDFEELCEFVEEFPFDRVNLFAFSKEEGTKAYNMAGAVESKLTKQRIEKLNEIIIKKQKNSFENLVGKSFKAIIDSVSKESDLLFSARDIRWDREIDGEIFINENLSDKKLSAGYYEIKVSQIKGEYLFGAAIKQMN